MDPKNEVERALKGIPGWQKIPYQDLISQLWETCGGLSHEQITKTFKEVAFKTVDSAHQRTRLHD